MRIKLPRAVGVAALLAAASLTPAAGAQVPGQPFRNPYKPYAVYSFNQAVQPVFVQAPVIANIRVQTAATVPDGGTVTLASYSQMSEGRNEFGVPILSRVPWLGRAFRNVGVGRGGVSARVTISARIIDLREEEFRQTGVGDR